MMHANPVLDAEHLAVFGARDASTGVITGGLVPDAALTWVSKVSIAPENWSDPNSWIYVGQGTAPTSGIPGNGDNVRISLGSVVIVDKVESGRLHTIRDDGTLRFNPHANTQLVVDTIIVEPVGTFQMGTDPTLADPLSDAANKMGQRIDADKQAKVIFADLGPIDLNWDPLQFSRGLVSHGDVSIFGATVTSFVQLAVDAKIGDKTLDLATAPTGWKVGDRLVLTGDTATNSSGVSHDEEVQIASLGTAADGNTTVTLSAPNVANWTGLKYNHAVVSGYLSDVSRNAIFQSENPNIVAERGHVMFMHNANVHVDAAGFYGLGRTDKRNPIDDPVISTDPANPSKTTTDVIDSKTGQRVMVPVVDAAGNPVLNADGTPKLQVARTGLNVRGRYAVHFHRAGSSADAPATISDSAVVDSPGWGIVNHSSNVNVDNNVVFNVVGAAFVTEAGDELGRFDHNLAIKSSGSGAGTESRKSVQDFGHEGDGFWLQGGNVSLTNNIVASQRHSGYIFFPVGLDQKGLGVTQIAATDLANPSWAGGKTMVADGDVPLREFKGNVAFATGDGFESWFSLLNISGTFADQRNVIENFQVFDTKGNAIFTPYTNATTFINVTATGNINAPTSSAFAINDVTRNLTYDHVHAVGWDVGINAPLNGSNQIKGGFYNNLRSIRISTANSRDRTVDINGNTNPDGTLDLTNPLFGSLSAAALHGRQQLDVALAANFDPKDDDLSKIFNPDVIRMGTVTVNDRQLYYRQQAADFKPFDTTVAGSVPSFVPTELQNQTNQQLFDKYHLAVGGTVAPADATASNPRIDGLIGSKASYLPDVKLTSAKYVNDSAVTYQLSYKYFDPTDAKHDSKGYVSVHEATPIALQNGWNLVQRSILGTMRTLLVYDDVTPPSLVVSASTPTTINRADLDNGATFTVEGTITDDSTGSKHFYHTFKLNDPKVVSALQTDARGTFVMLSFTIKDLAGNASIVSLRLDVTTTATLIKDIGRKTLPTIAPSVTLLALLADAALTSNAAPGAP